MINIPQNIINSFDDLLIKRSIEQQYHRHYKKWLRYYLDFCWKYNHQDVDKTTLPYYIKKLQEKNQNQYMQNQAAHAISLYYELTEMNNCKNQKVEPMKESFQKLTVGDKRKEFQKIGYVKDLESKDTNNSNNEAPGSLQIREPVKISPTNEIKNKQQRTITTKKSANRNPNFEKWSKALDDLTAEIRVRHYSRKTLKTYAQWVRKFQFYLKNKKPQLLDSSDVKEFLTYLAVKQNVSASTQNQAFNALLFFYRHVVKRDFGEHKDIVRAKKKPYIPVVLSRDEVNTVICNLTYPFDLIVKLLYGCGLRLFECLTLRVNNFNFDNCVVTVHDGKGKKDRTVPLPEKILPELNLHLENVKELYQKDLKAKYDGAFMFDSIEKKYKNCSKELIWQWFFPA